VKLATLLFAISVGFSFHLFAQEEHHHHMAEMETPDPAADWLMEQASGTSLNPPSAPMHMSTVHAGSWNLAFHGLVFITQDWQTGPRGRDKFFSANWFMMTAQHQLGKGMFQFRSMLSLDPATIPNKQYPLLFQTGETAFGHPLIDAQHPHDLFMELSVQYILPLTSRTAIGFYYAPMGDPALGPVAFPHRISASEFPQATLSHHYQDSSHIVAQVVTGQFKYRSAVWEFSGFHGAEPDENRWNIESGAIDSWATRFTLSPRTNWSAQFSIGHLHHPEALEENDITRITASLTYNEPSPHGNWATSFIFGQNRKSIVDRVLNSYVVETVYQFKEKNYLSGRFETVDKDELEIPPSESVYRITSFTAGYTRDVNLLPWVLTGVGGNFTVFNVSEQVHSVYGDHPAGFFLFLRIRQKHTHG
jgi:hypothetical protein